MVIIDTVINTVDWH